MPLTDEAAAGIAAKWSTNFTAMASGGDITAFAAMFADGAKLTIPPSDKTMTITKGEPDPPNGIVTVAMLQGKMAPEFAKASYKQTVMSALGVQSGSFIARVQRYNASWVPYFTQYAVLDVDDAGLITFVRAFSEPTNDKANAAGVAAAE